ncbi:hypothetical protein Tco_0738100 [Tanacetum coccineum]
MLDSDFIPSDDSLGSGLEVSFPSGTRNKIFDLGIFFEGQITSDFSKSPMMISGWDIPFLDVLISRIMKTLVLVVLSIVHSMFNPSHAYIRESDILDLIDLTFIL